MYYQSLGTQKEKRTLSKAVTATLADEFHTHAKIWPTRDDNENLIGYEVYLRDVTYGMIQRLLENKVFESAERDDASITVKVIANSGPVQQSNR